MPALSSPSNFWYKGVLTSGSGKVELPFEENEPLDNFPGETERCELRIEGMTCGSCVEVSLSALPSSRVRL